MIKSGFNDAANVALESEVSVQVDAKVSDLCDTFQRQLRQFKGDFLSVCLCPDNQDFRLIVI